jgi:hypothetical protein
MRIEKFAFCKSGLHDNVMPSSVEILGMFCFSFGSSLVSHQSGCRGIYQRMKEWFQRCDRIVSLALSTETPRASAKTNGPIIP